MSRTFSSFPRLFTRMAATPQIPEGANSAQGIAVWRPAGFEGMVFYRGVGVTHAYPRHWHDELHLCAYFAGSGYLFLRGSTHRISSGDFVVTPPGEVHENWVDQGSSITFRSVYLDVPMLCALSEQITGKYRPAPEFSQVLFQDEIVQQRFLRMHRAMESPISLLCREELFLDLLRCLVARCSDSRASNVHSGRERAVVRRLRSYIDEKFAESISLEDLARLANLSPFHAHRVFCQETGMPPHAYQTQVRINRAKELMRKRWELSDIALATGFADQSHLTRHFRRLVGVTPGRYCS